ncbi:helix-turn-helix domain-containing protein [Streptomyces sp. NPDC054863]
MDDTYLSAPGSVPVGVQHVKYRHLDRFTVVGNHLAQNRNLSLVAIGLGVFIQSLPDGFRIGIKELARDFDEGERRISSALRELEDEGYLERRRVRRGRGRFATLTRFFEHPAARVRASIDIDAGPEPEPEPGSAPGSAPGPLAEDGSPTGASGATRAISIRGRSIELPLPTPRLPVSDVRRQMACELLAGLVQYDRRLLLPGVDVLRLAPAVCAWMERGITADEVRTTLLRSMPDSAVPHPAGFVRWRLAELLPFETPTRTRSPYRSRPAVEPPVPFQNCDECGLAFRTKVPGLCRGCRATATATLHALCMP